jgi:hypothetical protein
LTLLSDLQSKAKTTAKALLPKTIVNFISGCRYRGYLAHTSYLLKLKKYRTQYAKANAKVTDSTIVLPAGCRVFIPPDADVRNAFEHFGWKDPEMVDEFIGFMKLASNAKILWDVGALFGLFSLAFTLRGTDRRALAFEPNPSSIQPRKSKSSIGLWDCLARWWSLSAGSITRPSRNRPLGQAKKIQVNEKPWRSKPCRSTS